MAVVVGLTMTTNRSHGFYGEFGSFKPVFRGKTEIAFALVKNAG